MRLWLGTSRRLTEREEELSIHDEALSAREEAARRATEEAQGVRKEIERQESCRFPCTVATTCCGSRAYA